MNITAEDMKHATIKAYDVNGNEVNNAFVIKGYSSNAQNSYSTVQVRIEGDFKVSTTNVQKEWWEDWNSQRIKDDRYNNRITYTVSATKELEFPLIEKDNGYGQLYEKLPNGEYIPMSVSLDIDMGASFGFWDEDNVCPATKDEVMWPGTHETWYHGGIPNDLIGMDFELGGDAEKAGSKIVAVEITKLLVDENGHRIHPDSTEHIVNSFNLYQDADGNPNSVVGLNIDNYTTPVDYTGYEYRHSKDLKVGADGMGLVYDYAVTPGMFYLQEDKETIPDTIKDRSGETWHYVGTRIETESPWRDSPDYDGHMHVSDFYTKADGSYNSTPEILGNYNDINGNTRWYNPKTQKEEDIRNGFLEFYVYNVYEPEKTEVTVKKEWENGSAPENASVDVVLKRYKLVKDGSITPPEPTSADLIISDSYSGLSGDRTYSASYQITGPENFNRTVSWTGEPIVLENLPFGEYTITKTASGQDGYDADNLREELTVTLGVAGSEAVFAETVYTRQNTTDIYYRVLVYAYDTTNQGSENIASNGHYAWVDEVYKAGTVLNFTVGVPAWNSNSTYSYSVNDGSRITITRGTTATERITVNRDIMIIIYGTTPYYSLWLDPIPSVSTVSVPNQARMMASGMRVLGAAPVTTLTNTGSNPEVPGYTWQEDSTWYDGEGLTVHLPYEGNWEKVVGDLEKEDAFGNLYVYYIASVTENGMPSGMSAQITLNGENKLFVYGDHADENAIHKEDTLKVKNILATGTTITIQKVIKGTLSPLTGAEFTIRKYSDQDHRSEEKTGGFPLVQSVDGNGQIVLDDLQIGYYKLEESNPPAGYVKVSEDPYFEVRRNPSTKGAKGP